MALILLFLSWGPMVELWPQLCRSASPLCSSGQTARNILFCVGLPERVKGTAVWQFCPLLRVCLRSACLFSLFYKHSVHATSIQCPPVSRVGAAHQVGLRAGEADCFAAGAYTLTGEQAHLRLS